MPRAVPSLARVPVRVRVTLAFAVVMAVLLTATGLFLYVRLGHDLDATLNQGLRSRAGDVIALIRQADSGLAQAGRSPLTEEGESFAQILDRSGRVVDATPPLRRMPLLTPAELRRAARGTIMVEHRPSAVSEDPVRLLATPVSAQDQQLVAVVGASLEPRDVAQDNLRSLLLLGGPVALLLASLAGYGAAAGALRPVESMRRRAGEIRASAPGRRLPVPPSGDEVARLGETLNDMLARLEHAFEREQSFTADASHELRAPLAVLKGELELALRDASTVEAFRAAVASASEEADRLVELTEDLLVLARSEQGRLPVRREALGARELLEGVGRRAGPALRAQEASFTVRAPEDLRVVGDRVRLEQALGNLVDNAVRHGGTHIEAEALATPTGVELHVRDDGPGFGEAFLAHAFERFSRADEARGRGGTGLGLAIVAAIAATHGGSARAEDRPGGGADVALVLPGVVPREGALRVRA
jgi:two-component system OmpR family sensor kinase